METFNQVWAYVQPVVTSATFGAIFTAIICGIIKGTISKKFAKLNIDDEFNKIVDTAMDRIKEVAFKHDIEPIVESRLVDIKEQLTAQVNANLEIVKDIEVELAVLIGDLEKYFKNSSAVPQETKDEFMKEMAKIMEIAEKTEVKVAEATPVIEEKKEDNKHKKNAVER